MFQKFSKKQLKFFKRFKLKDQFRLFATRFASRGNSFQKKFRNNLKEKKRFSLFYGGLKKRYFKTKITSLGLIKNRSLNDARHNVIQFFESRLDVVLYRSGFCLSIKEARKFILYKHVLVNKSFVTTGSYILKPNDLIEISENFKSRNFVKKNLLRFNFWPIPTKHLLINYKTLHILFLYTDSFDLAPRFNHYLNLDSVISNIKNW